MNNYFLISQIKKYNAFSQPSGENNNVVNTETRIQAVNTMKGPIIPQNVLLIGFGIFLVVYIGVSWVLWYHWSRYGASDGIVLFAQGIYFVSTILLLLIGIVSIL